MDHERAPETASGAVIKGRSQDGPKHTPGPWAIHHDGKPLFGYWHIRQDPPDWNGRGYQAIATLPATKKGSHYGDMFHANARLIAAAPDLLMACKDCLENRGDWSAAMFAAIARAEGRTS